MPTVRWCTPISHPAAILVHSVIAWNLPGTTGRCTHGSALFIADGTVISHPAAIIVYSVIAWNGVGTTHFWTHGSACFSAGHTPISHPAAIIVNSVIARHFHFSALGWLYRFSAVLRKDQWQHACDDKKFHYGMLSEFRRSEMRRARRTIYPSMGDEYEFSALKII